MQKSAGKMKPASLQTLNPHPKPLLYMQGIAKLAKRMTTHINSTRQDLRSAVISWVNFIFLPEVFNR